MVVNPPKMKDDHRPEGSRGILFAALALIPLAAGTGAALDFGMGFLMREKLDAVAQSALASALAQSRELRDGRYNVTVEDMQLKGRGRADLVFNAQKPNLRDIRTTYTLRRGAEANVFDARVSYVASVNTVFLRFAGLPELEIAGAAMTTWVARDALIDDKFELQQADIVAAERKVLPPPSGWWSSARTKVNGAPVVQLADARRYDGPPPPDDVKIAVELDTVDGNVFISKKFAAEPGAHQLRYWYRDRAEDRQVAPAWLCGTREEDVAWMRARQQPRRRYQSAGGLPLQRCRRRHPHGGNPERIDANRFLLQLRISLDRACRENRCSHARQLLADFPRRRTLRPHRRGDRQYSCLPRAMYG